MNQRKKITILFFIISFLMIITLSFNVYALISKTSTRGKIEVSTMNVSATSSFTSSTSSFTWTYTEAGQTKEIDVATTSSISETMHNKYTISISGASDANLANAILVYYNDNYVGNLKYISEHSSIIFDEYSFIPALGTLNDSLKFELHQGAVDSIFDDKSVSITITAYTENVDYLGYIVVKNEADFKKAVDDVNSGLFAEQPTIVLGNTLTLTESYTLVNRTKLVLGSYNLNGSTITINDDDTSNTDALLEVYGTGKINATVSLGANYDANGAKSLVINYAKQQLKSGVAAGTSLDILGYYSFYSPTVSYSGSAATYSNSKITAKSTSNEWYTKVENIIINNESVSFKVLGSQTALLSSALAHIPNDADTTITYDLFLPTAIPAQNAVITWTSSNESLITNSGKIVADKANNESVVMYARIKVNNREYVQTFSFNVSVHNNEINFYKLVQEISPLIITNVYSSAEDASAALYYLPIVTEYNTSTNKFGSYDYRSSFKSPSGSAEDTWLAYRDIGLVSLSYDMTESQSEAYDYITLGSQTTGSNSIYLNKSTLNNYAEITITGDFGNEEVYSTIIHISIAVGSNTQLLEKAFTQVSDELANVSVLGNILKTRIEDGILNEKGDFSLSAILDSSYVSESENASDYSISYEASSDILSITPVEENSVVVRYIVSFDPTKFLKYETQVPIKATVSYLQTTSKTRTFYITIPAALHIEDFGTISIFNSTKYQVISQLPANEISNGTGFNTTSTLITNTGYDYILLRDIVGDNEYISQYAGNNDEYLEVIEYTASSQYAQGTKTLKYYTSDSNNSSMTDNAAYDFAKLIEWATGSTRATCGSVITNTAAISGLTGKKANAKDYLNDDEIEVLKAYYQYYTGATDAQWNAIKSEILNTAPGYMFTDSGLLNQVIAAIGADNIASSYSTLFGKYMEVLQRYAVSTTTVNNNGRCIAPCQAQYNATITWYHSKEAGLTSFKLKNYSGTEYTISVDGYYVAANEEYWYYHTNQQSEFNTYNSGGKDYRKYGPDYLGGGDGEWGGFYATPDFESDKTSYITDPELQVLLMFWLNNMKRNNTFSTTQQGLITAALTNGQTEGYYLGYESAHFLVASDALINAFYACLEIPTSFATDGISKIMKYFYDNYNRNSVKYELKNYGTSETTTFVAKTKNGVPTVTNLDNLKASVSYFSELTSLTIQGNSYLSIFLSEYGLSTAFARSSLSNDKVTSLEMNYLANSSVNFDLTNIKNYFNLTILDLSNNPCIQSTNELININRSKYTHVDIQNIGVEFKYQEFAIDNIASPTCTIVYTNESGNREESNDNSNASCLANLSDFDEFITKYFYETTVVYDDAGNEKEVYWRIDEGNAIQGVSLGGSYPEINSISSMNQFLSPYYYCSQSFSYNNQNFTAGYLYKLYVLDDNVVFTIVGRYTEINSLTGLASGISEPEADFSDYSVDTEITEEKDIEIAGTITYQSRTNFYNESAINNTVTITLRGYYLRNKSYNRYYMSYRNFKYNGSFLGGGDGVSSTSRETIFVFLTAEQFTKTVNKSYTTSQSLGQTYSRVGSNTYYMCFLYNNELYAVSMSGDSFGNDLDISCTKDISQALKVSFTTNGDYYYVVFNSYRVRMRDAKTVTYHANTDNKAQWSLYSTNQSSSSYPQYQYVFNPSFTITYNTGLSETIEAYAAGYRIKKTENTDFTVTETESTVYDYYIPDDTTNYYYYKGEDTTATDVYGNTVPIKQNSIIGVSPTFIYPVVSRERSYRIVGTVYSWEFWYCETYSDYYYFANYNYDPTGTIDGSLISMIETKTTSNNNIYYADDISENLPSDSVTRTNLSPWDNWDDQLESAWEYSGVKCYPYISYVEEISGSSKESLDKKMNLYSDVLNDYSYVYKYTGSTGSEYVYQESIDGSNTSYTQNYFYLITLNYDGTLGWEYYSNSLYNDSGTTMDSILATANSHFKDYLYGSYYGMYYAYSGDTKYISSGIYVKQNYVYRIMPNSSNTAFEWVEVKPFVTDTSSNILLAMGTNNASVGDIFLSTENAFDHFQPAYYKIVLDGKTNIVNLVKYDDITISWNSAHTVAQLTNAKTKAISAGDYLGYSGTFTAEISAVYRTYDGSGNIIKEYVKTYKIKLVGFLT